ncbi:hypothetical protein Tco_1251075 [Tanacetum coccineum]
MTQATIQAGQITTESVQRRAPATRSNEKKQEKDSTRGFQRQGIAYSLAKEKGALIRKQEAEAFFGRMWSAMRMHIIADVEVTKVLEGAREPLTAMWGGGGRALRLLEVPKANGLWGYQVWFLLVQKEESHLGYSSGASTTTSMPETLDFHSSTHS